MNTGGRHGRRLLGGGAAVALVLGVTVALDGSPREVQAQGAEAGEARVPESKPFITFYGLGLNVYEQQTLRHRVKAEGVRGGRGGIGDAAEGGEPGVVRAGGRAGADWVWVGGVVDAGAAGEGDRAERSAARGRGDVSDGEGVGAGDASVEVRQHEGVAVVGGRLCEEDSRGRGLLCRAGRAGGDTVCARNAEIESWTEYGSPVVYEREHAEESR